MTCSEVTIKDGDDLWQFATDHGLQAVGDLLRDYVRHDQPESFCEGYTSRAMCRIASKAVEGVKDDEDPRSYIDTKYGTDLYFYMWGGDGESLPNDMLTVSGGKTTGTPEAAERYFDQSLGQIHLPLYLQKAGFCPPHPEPSEATMGWPIGWTDLRPLEMDRFRRWLRSHGKHCRKDCIENAQTEHPTKEV